ncbi:MAG: hypothetical protein V4694_01250 [Pseudomonadota bacterium]
MPTQYEALKETLSELCGKKWNDTADDWINTGSSDEQRYDNFLTIAKDAVKESMPEMFGILNRDESIVLRYQKLGLPIDKIPDLCRELYFKEGARTKLFLKFVEKSDINPNKLVEITKDFVHNLNDEEKVILTLQVGKIREAFQGREDDILHIANARAGYDVCLSSLLSRHSLQESLDERGLAQVKIMFKLDEIPPQITLSSLFFYYDFKNRLEVRPLNPSFTELLKPEMLSEIKREICSQDNALFLTKRENRKLASVIPIDLPQIEILANYLKSKSRKVLDLVGRIDDYQINFDGYSGALLVDRGDGEDFESRKARINLKFRELLSFSNFQDGLFSAGEENMEEIANLGRMMLQQNAQEVSSFIKEIIDPSVNLSEENELKLYKSFAANKFKLALIFSEEGGIDRYVGSVGQILKDGCVSNLGTSTGIAVGKFLFAEKCDQNLYSIFVDKIAIPILDSQEDALGADAMGLEIFDSSIINDNYILPKGLALGLQEVFKGGSKRSDAWEVILESIGEEKSQQLSANILQNYPHYYEGTAAKIATYFELQKSLPQLFENEYMWDFKDEVEVILSTIEWNKIPRSCVIHPEVQQVVQENEELCHNN